MLAYNQGMYEVIKADDNHLWVVFTTVGYQHRVCRFEQHYKEEANNAAAVAALLNKKEILLDLSV